MVKVYLKHPHRPTEVIEVDDAPEKLTPYMVEGYVQCSAPTPAPPAKQEPAPAPAPAGPPAPAPTPKEK